MKVVLDTNVFISAFLWQKLAKEIFNLVKEEKAQVCVSKEILEELQRVLNYPKFSNRLRLIDKTSDEIISEFLEVVKLYPSKKFKTVIVEEDPSDDKFLSCALSCGASFIISGDKHLLALREFQGIPILSPKEFLKTIKK
jgi:putative PIN family toxin of toxin-antitoxin system